MFKYVKKLIQFGVRHSGEDKLLAKKIRLTNTAALVLGLTTVPFVFVFDYLGGEVFAFVTAMASFIFLSCPLLNAWGKYNLSRNLLLFVWSLGVLIFGLFLGKHTGLQNCYFSLIAMPFIIFKPNEGKIKYIHLLLPLFAFFLIEFNVIQVHDQELISNASAITLSTIVNAAVLVQLMLILYYYGFYERALILENAQTQSLNNELQWKSTEMFDVAKELATTQKGLNAVLESLDDLVLEVDSKAIVTNFWTTQEVNVKKGERASLFFGEYLESAILWAFKKSSGETIGKVYEYQYNGVYWQFKITTIQKQDHKQLSAVVALRDITAQKEASEGLEKAEKDREVAIAEAKFKEEFLASMSHEIRTPLNGVVGMIDLLGYTELNEVQKDYVKTLSASSSNLLTLINDILDLSKIQAGKMSVVLKPMRLHELLKNVVDLFTPIAKSKALVLDININSSVPIVVNADETRLNQILTNLVSNAVKFTRKGKVSLNVYPQNQNICFEVIDTGDGISEEGQKILFKKFTQLDNNQSSSVKGTGLGLSIVSELVKLMGGEIRVESEVGKGSVFAFSLQLDAVKETAAEVNDHPKLAGCFNQLKVLLVDDITVNRKVASLMLKKLNCVVDEAENGAIAVENISLKNYDIVLMDIQMPVMNGIEALKKIKQGDNNEPIVIALSANALEGDEAKYKAMGFDGYLSKPITTDKLKNGLLKVLQKPISS